MIRCLLFDLDGTLFDSSEANIDAYTKAFEHLGIAFDEVQYKRLFGLRFDEMMDKIAPGTTPNTRQQIQQLKSKFYKANLALVKINEGLIDLVASSVGKFQTGLVTTASRTNVENLLRHFKIPFETFGVIITGEDVVNGKPDPEAYLAAMKRLGAKPEECCIFEDSEVGITAAQRAGAKIVRVRI